MIIMFIIYMLRLNDITNFFCKVFWKKYDQLTYFGAICAVSSFISKIININNLNLISYLLFLGGLILFITIICKFSLEEIIIILGFSLFALFILIPVLGMIACYLGLLELSLPVLYCSQCVVEVNGKPCTMIRPLKEWMLLPFPYHPIIPLTMSERDVRVSDLRNLNMVLSYKKIPTELRVMMIKHLPLHH